PKLGEHAAYFWRVKQAGKWRVGHTPAAVIDHDQSSRSNDYRQHRGRASIMQGAWFREQGISGGYRQDQALGRAAEPALAKPNVLILGVGHSGTSILAQMLFAAGWRRGDADEAFGESVSVRCVNQSAKRGQIDLRQAKAALAQLPEPWALKDPRFHITLPAWLPLLAELQRPPLLVWLRRDSEQVAASYVTRGELSSEKAPLVVRARYAQCRRLFELWPWARVAIDYEQLAAAAGLFEQC
ncbi:MAG TPA: hypothetical protein VHY20_03075, partial [Pirellulales bacterium]|nr:hypothetical protein [Pirellulales bacterium]